MVGPSRGGQPSPPDSPLTGGQPRTQFVPKAAFPSPGQDTAPVGTAGPAPRPELDPVATRKALFSLNRYAFQDISPRTVTAIVKDLEIGRMTRPADLMARVMRETFCARSDWHRRQAVAGKPISVEPNPSAPKYKLAAAQANADYATMVVASLQSSGHLEEVLLQQLTANGLGLAIAETEWGMRSGWWMPVHFHPVLTREVWLDLDWTPTVWDRFFLRHRTAAHPGKFWVHRPQVTNGLLPDQGYFAGVVWLWLFKTMLWRFRMNAAERFGTPLIVAYIEQLLEQSQTVPPDVRDAVLEAIKGLTVDSVAVAPAGTKIEINDPKGTGSAEIYQGAMTALDTEIQVRILGMATKFTAGPNGNRSAEEVRDEGIDEGAAQDSRLVLGSFKRDVIAHGLAFNGLDPDPSCMPVLKTVFAKDELDGPQTTAMQGLVMSVAAGQLPRDAAAAIIMRAYAMTQDEADQILGSAGKGFIPTPATTPGGGGAGGPFQPRSGPLGGMPDLTDPRTR